MLKNVQKLTKHHSLKAEAAFFNLGEKNKKKAKKKKEQRVDYCWTKTSRSRNDSQFTPEAFALRLRGFHFSQCVCSHWTWM